MSYEIITIHERKPPIRIEQWLTENKIHIDVTPACGGWLVKANLKTSPIPRDVAERIPLRFWLEGMSTPTRQAILTELVKRLNDSRAITQEFVL